MDKDTKDFQRFVDSQRDENGNIPSFVGEWAETYINEENVEDILRILASLNKEANLTFWENINNSPTTDEGWNELIFVYGEMDGSQETQAKIRAMKKRVTNIVRNTKYYKNSYNELFKS